MGRNNAARAGTPRGFTLIELLVVIAIIGLLSAIVLAALTIARSKALDAQRFSDLHEMKTAIEGYYADHGSYPISSGAGFNGICTGFNLGGTLTSEDNIVPGLVSGGYISHIPTAPQAVIAPATDCYLYRSTSSGTNYKFMDYKSSASYPPSTGATPSGPLEDPNYGTIDWSIYSPGGALGL